MFQQFNLQDHLGAIKMFFLTGKGDFIQSLMESNKEKLSEPRHQIQETELDNMVFYAAKYFFPKMNQPQSFFMKQGV